MTAEPNTSMTTDQALAAVREARGYIDESTMPPGSIIETTEESAQRASDLLDRFDDALSVLTQEIERLTDGQRAVHRVLDNAGIGDGTASARIGKLWGDANAQNDRADQLAAAIQRCCDESDYCYACDCHPSHGHAPNCPLTEHKDIP